MDIILDDEFVTFKDGGFRLFLVKWHDRPDFDATWIHEDDLRHLDSSLLDPEGMMGHGVGPHLGLYKIGSL